MASETTYHNGDKVDEPRVVSRAEQNLAQAKVMSARAITATVRGNVLPQILNSLSFAQAFAWKSAVLVCVRAGNLVADPDSVESGELWVAAAFMSAILVPVITLMNLRRRSIKRQAEEARRQGDYAKFLSLQATDMSYEAIVSWGLTFAVAAQLDSAASASLPKSPVVWRIVYFVTLLVLLCIPTMMLQLGQGCGSTSMGKESLLASTIDTLLTGSAYAAALALFRLTEVLFAVDNVVESENLDFLAIYTCVFLLCSTICLAVLGIGDKKENEARLDNLSSKDLERQAVGCIRLFGRVQRRYLSKVIALSTGCVLYVFCFVLLAKLIAGDSVSVYDPLPIGAACGLFSVALLFAIISGFLLERLTGLETKLASFDVDATEGKLDDAAVASLQALSQTTRASLTMALAWLVGCSFHGLAAAVWKDIVDHNSLNHGLQICAAIGLALILTLFAVLASFMLPPPPKDDGVATESADSGSKEVIIY